MENGLKTNIMKMGFFIRNTYIVAIAAAPQLRKVYRLCANLYKQPQSQETLRNG